MATMLMDRLLRATREELARTLEAFCREVGAAESSILLPVGDTELVFFASTNPALMQPGAPRVPIMASFSGIAFRTGQTVAVADAASQASHYKAVDDLVGSKTREFAAVPFADRVVLGVLTLMNRATRNQGASSPFTIAELRSAGVLGGEIASAITLFAGITGATSHGDEPAQGFDRELTADLARLNDQERRIVRAVVSALIENRAE